MLAALGQIRFFCDADNSTDIAHFDKMKPLFDQGYDLSLRRAMQRTRRGGAGGAAGLV